LSDELLILAPAKDVFSHGHAAATSSNAITADAIITGRLRETLVLVIVMPFGSGNVFVRRGRIGPEKERRVREDEKTVMRRLVFVNATEAQRPDSVR
jgi:hypothetical protein